MDPTHGHLWTVDDWGGLTVTAQVLAVALVPWWLINWR